jgi:glycosyltransferase involved in cell wall biosynthesis/acetyltransferase-like isoleucine patch superfamily enzyme/ubiquinone/menaquinone biosynthesis C-methylase UbiE
MVPSFSFIIPAYNVEGFIGRTLQSILEQPVKSFEVIVIDDGSTDGTAALVAEYAARDGRIRLYRQGNAGQGAARSHGLDLAAGAYVWCIDADDWLQSNALSRIQEVIDRNAPDVVVANFAYAFEGDRIEPSDRVPPHLAGRLVDPTRDEDTFSSVSCWTAPPWRLICRRSMIESARIRFPHGLFYEDHPFAIEVMAAAKRVHIDSAVSYFYLQRAGSTVHVNDKKIFDFLPIRRRCLELFRRFDFDRRFPHIACSYIVPLGFVQHHVPKDYRNQFLKALAEDLTADEEAHVEQHGSLEEKHLLAAIRRGNAADLDILQPASSRRGPLSRLRHVLFYARKMGWRRAARRAILFVPRRAMLWLIRRYGARILMLMQAQVPPAPAAPSQAPHLPMHVGRGSGAVHVSIDVRVAPEQRNYVFVGQDSLISGYFVFERGRGRVTIGDRSSIGHGCMFVVTQDDGIVIGNNVMISWNCTLIDTNAHATDPIVRSNDAYDWLLGIRAGKPGLFKDWSAVRSKPIVIEDQVWVGFGSAIMKGVTIGRGAVVAANSVVTDNIPAYTVHGGNPARFIDFVPREQWSWEEIVDASRGAPQFVQVLHDSYMGTDVIDSFERFLASGEWIELCAVLEEHAAPGPWRILEIGGGNGIVTLALALSGHHVTLVERSGDQYIGVGAAQRLLDYAREHYPEAAERIRIIQGDFESVPFDERFDIVYGRQVLHHFLDPVLSLRKVESILVPGGLYFAARDHVVWGPEDKEVFLKYHPYHRYYGGENAYTLGEYDAIFAAAGLELIRRFAFFETKINFAPRTMEDLAGLTEHDISGRPYSFLTRKQEAAA